MQTLHGLGAFANANLTMASATLLVTHGNLMALLLKYFDDRIGFAEWQQLTNPDVYRISLSAERAEIARIWDA